MDFDWLVVPGVVAALVPLLIALFREFRPGRGLSTAIELRKDIRDGTPAAEAMDRLIDFEAHELLRARAHGRTFIASMVFYILGVGAVFVGFAVATRSSWELPGSTVFFVAGTFSIALSVGVMTLSRKRRRVLHEGIATPVWAK